MENKTIARKIEFETPNTIDLKTELWNKQPVGAFTRDVIFYSVLLSIVILGVFIWLLPHTFLWIGLAMFLAAVINVSGITIHNSLTQKNRDKHLNYRKEKVPALVRLLTDEGYSLSEKEKERLLETTAYDFRITADGFEYRTAHLQITKNKISATFFLSDFEAKQILRQADREKRIASIVSSYETEHGEFASEELKQAFTDGLRRGMR